MPRKGLRFRPPPVDVPVEAAWLLRRAFGPRDVPWTVSIDPARAIELGTRLDLVARTATRISRSLLDAELGLEVAERFLAARREVAERALRLLRACERVAAVAAGARMPVVFLKGAALHLARRAPISGRDASDVDVLAPRSRCLDLVAGLESAGWRRTGDPASPHHLPALVADREPPVEVHDRVLGLRLPGSRGWLTVSELVEAGLVEKVAGLPSGSFVPAPDVLAAHAAVHAIAQHGFRPAGHQALRMVADVLDCRSRSDAPGAGLRRAAGLAAGTLSEAEVEAAVEMVSRLAAGDDEPWAGVTPGAVLLRHFLAGVLDADYAAALDLAAILHPVAERSIVSATAARLRKALFAARTPEERARKGLAAAAAARGLRFASRRVIRSARALVSLRLRRRGEG
jgi:hypothetical protein